MRVASDFLYGHYHWNNPARRTIYIPNPTWPNHGPLISTSGLKLENYRYYDPVTRGLDVDGLTSDWKSLPVGSVLLVHPSAHNPTGVDPSNKQWDSLAEIAKERNFMILFDSAYQGFVTTDIDDDVYAVRKFRSMNIPMVVAQSFSKNMGMYGQRVGAVHVVCDNKTEAEAVQSQIKIINRRMFSMPPAYGAYLASTVLQDKELRSQWTADLSTAVTRMVGSRQALYNKLVAMGTKHDWYVIINV